MRRLSHRCWRVCLRHRQLQPRCPFSPLSAPFSSVSSSSSVLHEQLSHLASPSNHRKGTAFEHLAIAVLSSLPSLHLSLQRQGGKGDQGVDFLGTWRVAAADGDTLLHRVIGQCKMEGRVMGPLHLRELEGTISQYDDRRGAEEGGAEAADAPTNSSRGQRTHTIGVLVSAQPYTEQAEAQWRRSQLPIVIVTIDPVAAAAMAGRGQRQQQPQLSTCLRRFSLNPTAAALLPSIRVRKQTLGGDGGYITVVQQQQQQQQQQNS